MLDKMDTTPIIRIAQTYPLSSQGAQLSFETYVPQDIDKEEIDKIVDKLELVAGRQALKGVIVDKKQLLEQADKQLSGLVDDYDRITQAHNERQVQYNATGRTGILKPSTKEDMDKKNTEITIKKLKDTKARLVEEIKQLEGIVGSNVSADS